MKPRPAFGAYFLKRRFRNLTCGRFALADKLQINPAEIDMQPPAESNGADSFPADWQAAIQLAVNHHPSISSSIATLESSGFTIDAAKAGYLPP